MSSTWARRACPGASPAACVSAPTRCASAPRPDGARTWITAELAEAFSRLHAEGAAHSAEAWLGGRLVGGLFGVALGGVFYGGSMFACAPDASKVAFATLLAQLMAWGVTLVDCQVPSAHLARFGAAPWPRARFLEAVETALWKPAAWDRWRLEPGVADLVATGRLRG